MQDWLCGFHCVGFFVRIPLFPSSAFHRAYPIECIPSNVFHRAHSIKGILSCKCGFYLADSIGQVPLCAFHQANSIVRISPIGVEAQPGETECVGFLLFDISFVSSGSWPETLPLCLNRDYRLRRKQGGEQRTEYFCSLHPDSSFIPVSRLVYNPPRSPPLTIVRVTLCKFHTNSIVGVLLCGYYSAHSVVRIPLCAFHHAHLIVCIRLYAFHRAIDGGRKVHLLLKVLLLCREKSKATRLCKKRGARILAAGAAAAPTDNKAWEEGRQKTYSGKFSCWVIHIVSLTWHRTQAYYKTSERHATFEVAAICPRWRKINLSLSLPHRAYCPPGQSTFSTKKSRKQRVIWLGKILSGQKSVQALLTDWVPKPDYMTTSRTTSRFGKVPKRSIQPKYLRDTINPLFFIIKPQKDYCFCAQPVNHICLL